VFEGGNVVVPAERVWVFGLGGLVFHRLVGLHICLGGGITVLSLAWNVISKKIWLVETQKDYIRGAQSALAIFVWRGLKPLQQHGPNVAHHGRRIGFGDVGMQETWRQPTR